MGTLLNGNGNPFASPQTSKASNTVAPPISQLFNERHHIRDYDQFKFTSVNVISDGYGKTYPAGTVFKCEPDAFVIYSPSGGITCLIPELYCGLHRFEYYNELNALEGTHFTITNQIPPQQGVHFNLKPGTYVRWHNDHTVEFEEKLANGSICTSRFDVLHKFSNQTGVDPASLFLFWLMRKNRQAREEVRYRIKSTKGIKDMLGEHLMEHHIIQKIDDDTVECNYLIPSVTPGGIVNGFSTQTHRKKIQGPSPSGIADSYPKFHDYLKDIKMKEQKNSKTVTFTAADGTTFSDSDGQPIDAPEDRKEVQEYDKEVDTGTIVKSSVDQVRSWDTTPLKKVYCPYNADLVVYDVKNRRVDRLCGMLTRDKFYELITRVNDDTKFDGFEHFKCAVCELGVIAESKHNEMDNDLDAMYIMSEAAQEHVQHILDLGQQFGVSAAPTIPKPKPADPQKGPIAKDDAAETDFSPFDPPKTKPALPKYEDDSISNGDPDQISQSKKMSAFEKAIADTVLKDQQDKINNSMKYGEQYDEPDYKIQKVQPPQKNPSKKFGETKESIIEQFANMYGGIK